MPQWASSSSSCLHDPLSLSLSEENVTTRHRKPTPPKPHTNTVPARHSNPNATVQLHGIFKLQAGSDLQEPRQGNGNLPSRSPDGSDFGGPGTDSSPSLKESTALDAKPRTFRCLCRRHLSSSRRVQKASSPAASVEKSKPLVLEGRPVGSSLPGTEDRNYLNLRLFTGWFSPSWQCPCWL